MEKPLVRKATSVDNAAVAAISGLTTAELRGVYRPTAAAIQQRSALAPELEGLVALVGQQIVGTVQHRIASRCLSILALGVHPDFRRRGIATALVRQLEIVATAMGCERVGLYTVRQTGNVPIFERMGFAVEAEGVTDLFESALGGPISEVSMTKHLR